MLQFGEVNGFILKELKAGDISRVTSELKQKLENEADNKSVLRPINLKAVQNKIDTIIVRYSAFLDPELANYLLKIRHEIDDALRVHDQGFPLGHLAAPLNSIAVNLKGLHDWLRGVADKEYNLQEKVRKEMAAEKEEKQ